MQRELRRQSWIVYHKMIFRYKKYYLIKAMSGNTPNPAKLSVVIGRGVILNHFAPSS